MDEIEIEITCNPDADLSQESYLEKVYGKENLAEWLEWDKRRNG